jgi:hypothetical protein
MLHYCKGAYDMLKSEGRFIGIFKNPAFDSYEKFLKLPQKYGMIYKTKVERNCQDGDLIQ